MAQRSEWRTRHLRPLIANRDNWTCHRCHQPINPTLRYPHPGAITLEHILELHAGGHPWHPDNLAVAHHHCNTSAGATYGNHKRRPNSRDW